MDENYRKTVVVHSTKEDVYKWYEECLESIEKLDGEDARKFMKKYLDQKLQMELAKLREIQ